MVDFSKLRNLDEAKKQMVDDMVVLTPDSVEAVFTEPLNGNARGIIRDVITKQQIGRFIHESAPGAMPSLWTLQIGTGMHIKQHRFETQGSEADVNCLYNIEHEFCTFCNSLNPSIDDQPF